MSDRNGTQDERSGGAGWAEMRRLGLLAVLAALVLAGPLGARFSSGGLPTLLRALSGSDTGSAQVSDPARADPLLRPGARSAAKAWRGQTDRPGGGLDDDALAVSASALPDSRIFLPDARAVAQARGTAATRPYQARAPPGAA
jgi:hypothetical protein